MQLRRSLEDASTWAVSAMSFLASPTHVHEFILSHVTDRRINDEAWLYLFPGYLPLILASVALIPARAAGPRRDVVRLVLEPVGARAGEAVSLMALAVLLYVIAIGPIRWRIGDWTILSVRDTPAWPPAGCRGRGPRGPGPACAVRLAPVSRDGGSAPGMARPAATRSARFLRAAGDPDVVAVCQSADSGCGRPSTGFPASTSSASPRGSRCSASCVWPMLGGLRFDSARRRPDVPPPHRQRRSCALLLAEFADIPLGTSPYRVQPQLRMPGSMASRSPSVSPRSRFPRRAREARNGGRPPSCFTRWRTGRRPSTATADFGAASLRAVPPAPTVSRRRHHRAAAALGVDYAVVHLDLYPRGRVADGRGAAAAVRPGRAEAGVLGRDRAGLRRSASGSSRRAAR